MSETDKPDITALMTEGTAIDRAIERAVRRAVREHKLLGRPIVIWRDGAVVWVPPEEIVVEDEPV